MKSSVMIIITLVMTILFLSCDQKMRAAEPAYWLESVGLELPRIKGWQRDDSIFLQDPNKGGAALRLVRHNALPGSPRIEVNITSLDTPILKLESFVASGLRELANLEKTDAIKITNINKTASRVGVRRAFRTTHEYYLKEPHRKTSSIAITQVTLFFIVDGRGIMVTAAGRTELFHPLAQTVDTFLSGIKTPGGADFASGVEIIEQSNLKTNKTKPAPTKQPSAARKFPAKAPPSKTNQPIDLGTLGDAP